MIPLLGQSFFIETQGAADACHAIGSCLSGQDLIRRHQGPFYWIL